KCHSLWRREAGLIRKISSAHPVQSERILERRGEVGRPPCDHDLEFAQLLQLTATAAVQAPASRRRLRRIHRLPWSGEVEHGRLVSLDEVQVAAELRESALTREPVEVRDVMREPKR